MTTTGGTYHRGHGVGFALVDVDLHEHTDAHTVVTSDGDGGTVQWHTTPEGAEDLAEALAVAVGTLKAAGATILKAFNEHLPVAAAQIATGGPVDDLPTPGRTANGKRLALTARHMARHHTATPEALAAIWYTYTAAIWADDDTAAAEALTRLVLCSAPPIRTRPQRGPRVLTTCTRPARGLETPETGNAPPARPFSRTQSLGGGVT